MKTFIKATFLFTIIFSLNTTNILANGLNNIDINKQIVLSTSSQTIRQDYIDKSNVLKTEIDTLTNKIKELNEYNSAVNQKLKVISDLYKTNKNIISSEKMKQIKELRKQVNSRENRENTISEDNSIKTFVKNKEYDKALEKYNLILEAKKEQYKVVLDRNAIWRQIDALIG